MKSREKITALPILHYNMEMAALVRKKILELRPDCIAVELAETMQLQLLHAASRLPDISIVITYDRNNEPIYYMAEPCDAAFEALRSGLEEDIPAFCIDLDIDTYPDIKENFPDPYAITRIGLERYYEAYLDAANTQTQKQKPKEDQQRELYMAKRLKELSFSYDNILFVGGMAHVESVLNLIDNDSFPNLSPTERERDAIQLCTLTEESCQEVMAECGWTTKNYELARNVSSTTSFLPPNRQKILYDLYKASAEKYSDDPFPGYHLRNIMKFARNYALTTNRLMPDLFQILTAAKGCVDHNYAYEVWVLATEYPHRRNVDGLLELDLSIEDVWGHSKVIRFHRKERRRKEKAEYHFKPITGGLSICSHPPEDIIVENFGSFLRKKGQQILGEEAARTIPFTTSLEDGIDTRETIRHWYERKLYVKMKGKPPGQVGSVVIIFDEDHGEEHEVYQEKFPWRTTWLGEHEQESDMAFYATPMGSDVVGPGICRCSYGGFMMSYPPRRMYNIWVDPDYSECRTKSEVLLMAAIDYAVDPVIIYVAAKPPRNLFKSFASRFGKKIIYLPIGQLAPRTLRKIRTFHVLDGYDKRDIAGDYIF